MIPFSFPVSWALVHCENSIYKNKNKLLIRIKTKKIKTLTITEIS